ncbi:MAG: RNA 3'-phosphate cyclase [Candidatus Eisenbacteria sp.]|nr:RNA 3'-phosphate cyclase [Candidatus Eisenbacteria bacterium]
MINIDGSKGEGGGQVLRTALSLSAWLGKPFRITRIRAGRPQPGLKAQHLTSVRAVAQVCGATVEGAEGGSRTLTFTPGAIRPGNYDEEVGTAGATTLVAQAAALPLLRANGVSLLRIRGGTHVAWSPPLDYLRSVYAPVLALLGLQLRPRLLRYGFYPRGGGQIGIEVTGQAAGSSAGSPAPQAKPLRLKRPSRKQIRIETTAVVCSLPGNIAERMVKMVARRLKARNWPTETRIVEKRGSTGTYVFIRVFSDTRLNAGGDSLIAGGFTGLAESGKRADKVSLQTADQALAFLESDACLDLHLADQLLLPAVLSGTALTFTTDRITRHLRTNAETISRFLGPCVETTKSGKVTVRRST